jgi:hypothetical protein
MSATTAGTIAKLALPVFLLLPSGCTVANLADVLMAGGGFPMGAERSGEINQLDTRRQEIHLSGGWGRTERIRYDNRTEVLYGQSRYSVRDLRRGDYVRVRVESDRNGVAYARRIQVQPSGQDRQGGPGQVSGRLQRFDGEVSRVDAQRGWFDLYDNRGDRVTVTLPYAPNRSVRDRFQRLRRGDRVRIEG